MSEVFRPGDMLPRPDVTHINERGANFVRKEIAEYCDEIVDLAWSSVNAYLDADKEHTATINTYITEEGRIPKGEIFGVFVQQDDMFTAPWRYGEPVKTFCIRLEPVVEEPNVAYDDTPEQFEADLGDQSDEDSEAQIDDTGEFILEDIDPEIPPEQPHADDKRYLKVHVPSGNYSIDNFVMPDQDLIDEVYIETGDGEDIRWYAVQRTGLIYEYIPDAYEDNERHKELTKREWQHIKKSGVPEVHKTVISLLQHIVDWKTVPQSIRVIK